MFQSICIKPQELTYPTDIGFIAENLLYYQNVKVIAGRDTLPVLFNNCGIERLLELLTDRNLKILIRENFLAVYFDEKDNGQTLNDIQLISLKDFDKEEFIFKNIFEASGRRGYSKRITQKLYPLIETIKYQSNICDLVRQDLNDSDYIKKSIIDIIKIYNPLICLKPEEIDYGFVKTEEGYLFNSNLNYQQINKGIQNNPNGVLSPTGLILNIMETRGDMHLASDLSSEITMSGIQTSLMKNKFHELYRRITKSSTELFQFNDFILSQGHAIREAINSGEKNFTDFFPVLDKAEKFRDWVRNIGDDKNIIQEYHTAVTKETWIDKIPSKSFRWSLFTGLGLLLDYNLTHGLGTISGIGLSIADTFLLDRVLKGWKPNVFVDKELKPFCKGIEDSI